MSCLQLFLCHASKGIQDLSSKSAAQDKSCTPEALKIAQDKSCTPEALKIAQDKSCTPEAHFSSATFLERRRLKDV
jgi:hypothetical protein